MSDQAAAALDSAADKPTAADSAKVETAKAADSAKVETAKAADSAKAETAKAADSAKAETSKAADSAKDVSTKVTGAVAGKVDAKADTDAPAAPRSMDEIEAELEATRQRLAGRLDDLQEYVKPKNVAQRQVDKLKGVFVDEYGGVKPDRVLVAVGVVVAVVALGVVVRRRRG